MVVTSPILGLLESLAKETIPEIPQCSSEEKIEYNEANTNETK